MSGHIRNEDLEIALQLTRMMGGERRSGHDGTNSEGEIRLTFGYSTEY